MRSRNCLNITTCPLLITLPKTRVQVSAGVFEAWASGVRLGSHLEQLIIIGLGFLPIASELGS
jgi:hypothetical protein